MALFDGKKGLVLGVANDHSIAWAIAQQIMQMGGECGFTHLPDREDDLPDAIKHFSADRLQSDACPHQQCHRQQHHGRQGVAANAPFAL